MNENSFYPPEDFILQEDIKNLDIGVSIRDRNVNKIKKIVKPDKILINKVNYSQNYEFYVMRLERAIFNVLSKVKLQDTHGKL